MQQPPRADDFVAYVGRRDLHDGRILTITRSERAIAVLVQTSERRTCEIEFTGVVEVDAVRAEGMLLYALAEFRADPPYRRFEFAPWDDPVDETDIARLSILATGFTLHDVPSSANED